MSAADDDLDDLLAGLEGDARAQRRELIERLLADGASPAEVREAAAEGRLVLLGVERALFGSDRHTPAEIAELSGVPLEQLDRQWRALGMVVGDPHEPSRSSDELEAAHRIKEFLDAGLDPDAITELARLMAMTMSQFAAANRQVIGRLLAERGEEGLGELDLAVAFRELATTLIPMIGPSLEHVFRLQLREQLRHAAVEGDGSEAAGEGAMAVAFADLVDFTRLGERLPPEELGRVTGRLGELAAAHATGPVRLVKLIGDAAMFASTDTGALADAMLDLIEAIEDEGEDFPGLRAGVSSGPVVPRGGDLYGRVVNLASRITGVARPGSVLVSAEVREALDGEFRFSDAGPKRLKGIDGAVRLYRCRDLDADGGGDGGGRRSRRHRG